MEYVILIVIVLHVCLFRRVTTYPYKLLSYARPYSITRRPLTADIYDISSEGLEVRGIPLGTRERL
jgi:hypothetical protein